jgi:hypothetical protein
MSTTDVETPPMSSPKMPIDTDEEFDIVAEPKTKSGKAIIWQCEVYHSEPDGQNCGSRWVDYAPNYNIVLEAAHQAGAPDVKLSGPEELPGGDWDCDFGRCRQTNTRTKVQRRIRRVVVTMAG